MDFATQMLFPTSETPSLEAEVILRLQRLRHERGLSLQEVYDATGIHIARLEARKANMTVLTLATLCRHYEVALADFFHGL
jgi:transcriptional regulator with XRE-family HTH domain